MKALIFITGSALAVIVGWALGVQYGLWGLPLSLVNGYILGRGVYHIVENLH
jgi:hypothetical protein